MRTQLAMGLALTLVFAGSAAAETIWLHQGKNDPATEGWTYNPFFDLPDIVAGAVGPVGPSEAEFAAEDAWKIVDPGSNTRPSYESPRMTPDQVARFFAQGWQYTVRMSAPLVSGTAHTRGFQIITPGAPVDGRVYRVYITTDANLQQTVTVYNLTGTQRPASPLSPGFHTYQLVGIPTGGNSFNVSLFIDGSVTPAVSNIPGFTKDTPSILPILTPTQDASFAQFGSFSAGGAGTLNVSHASFSIIPEPATCGIICAGFIGFALSGRMRRCTAASAGALDG